MASDEAHPHGHSAASSAEDHAHAHAHAQEGDGGLSSDPSRASRFSRRAFLQGLAVVAALYALILSWAALTPSRTAEKLLERIPSQIVPIRAAGQAAPLHAATAGNTPETSHGTGHENEHGTDHASDPATLPLHPAPASSASADNLPAAPIDGLHIAAKDGGKLPVIRTSDGLTAFEAYRRPFNRQVVDKPVISLAIVGLGLSAAATESAIRAMPPEVSLALSPYAATPDMWVTEARARGHEVWLTLPLEGARYPAIDPGPHTLMIGAPATENEARLNWVMSRTAGYVGLIAGSVQSSFMKSQEGMRPVIDSIYGHGLAFADIGAETGSIPETVALGLDAPYTNIDLVIDDVPDKDSITAQLAKLEELARTQRSASAILHPIPVSYQAVLEWIKSLPGKGIVLAPLSAHAGY